jgi:predicted transcriptional regulator
MNKAKLSYSQTEEYLPLLIEKGFLVNLVVSNKRQTIRFFKTSDSGRKFLESLRMLEIQQPQDKSFQRPPHAANDFFHP